MDSTSRASFASFAPYTPPPDENTYAAAQAPSSSSRFARPWFPPQPSNSTQPQSYQSGGLPVPDSSASTGFGSESITEDPSTQNQWETRLGYRVDVLAAFAYILGPLSAFMLLAFETQNDYVRFHAYQSALFTTPFLLTRIIGSILQFPSSLKTLLSLLLIFPTLFLSYQAFTDASRNGLSRYHAPFVGSLAEQWLQDE